MVAVLILLGIAMALFSIFLIKKQNELGREAALKRQGLGVKCKKAISEIRIALDADKKLTGGYPYDLDNAFMDRYTMLDRYVYNKEIWSPHVDNRVELQTAFGESYILTGYCRDGFMYTYDSVEDKLYTRRFSLKTLQGDGS